MKKIKNYKGFTLIEIIVCISLISIICVITFVSISKSNNSKIEKFYSQFDDALEVYLSTHSEIYDNIYNNVEGAVITLNALKNEGLISDDIIDPETDSIIDYENKYYLLSDAVLLSNVENLEEGIEQCDGMVEISVLKSWETLKDKVDTSDVIYICPKNESDINNETSNTTELEERVSKLETILQRMSMNDKNYVIFDVNSDTSKLAYFPNNAGNNDSQDYNDIWRIVTNKNSSSDYTLMYNQNINTNYSSLFPTVNDIISYDSKSLTKFTKNVAKSYSDCKNGIYISDEVYSVSAASLGNYYSFDSDSDLGYIQNLYKVGDKYYKSLSSYSYNCYYLPNAIEDVDNYITKEYSFLKKGSSYDSYYFSGTGRYSLDLFYNTNNLDYISMFDLRDRNPFKDDLYGAINSNLKSHIKQTKNSYKYSLISSTNTLIQSNDNSFNSTYFRSLTKDEVNKNQSWLSTFTIPIGLYISDQYEVSDLAYLDKVVSSYKYTPIALYYVYSSYGEITYKATNIVRAYKSSTIGGDSSRLYISSRNPSYYLTNAKYNPVIDLENVTLITNINNYSSNYKTKRSSCTNADLGTYDCPYLLKIGSYYSDGTTN